MAEKQTVPHLNALMCGSKIQREQPCRSVRGCHATSPLKSVLFRRKVVWQPLIELYCCTWHILEPTSRATKWGIICFPSLSGSLSNPLRLKLGKVGVEQIRNRVYFTEFCLLGEDVCLGNHVFLNLRKNCWSNFLATKRTLQEPYLSYLEPKGEVIWCIFDWLAANLIWKFKWAWQAQFLSYTLLILEINVLFQAV